MFSPRFSPGVLSPWSAAIGATGSFATPTVGFRRQPATPGFKLPLQSIKQILLTNHFSLCNIRFTLSEKN